MHILICDCNQTMPLQPQTLGTVLHENLTLHSALRRHEVGAFQKAIQSGDDVIVACTQETRLFAELAQQTEGSTSVIKFINIRETGGWSKDDDQASLKISALLAVAHLPYAEPVPAVTYKSAGRLLVIGEIDAAERAAEFVSDTLDVMLFSLGAGRNGGIQDPCYPVLAGQIQQLTGWLGAFELKWTRSNPIDLDLCIRCNSRLSACPKGAIGLDYQINSKLSRYHRDCVKVCGIAGAIDFSREPKALVENFDLVFDLRAAPAFTRHAPPQRYFCWDGQDARSLMRLRSLVGEFEKPKFFNYLQKLCAQSRNEKIGCSACIDVCLAEAINSEKSRQQIVVNPNLCVGCGACTTVCPTGAIFHAYPRASEQGVKLKTLLAIHARVRWRCRLRRTTTISLGSFGRSRFLKTPDCRHTPHALQR